MPEAGDRTAGLLVRGREGAGTQVPLVGVRVEAEIRECTARTRLRQRYRNDERGPIEAVYVFPIDEGAAVCGFEALIGETRVVARAMERDEAFETYDDAMSRGYGAYLLDQERPDVFTASIGNLPAGGEVEIQITTVAELPVQGDQVRFVVPTTISPRYAPAQDRVGVGRSPAEVLNPPLAPSVPYGLELAIDVVMGAPLAAVESPSHAVRVEMTGDRARVELGERSAALDRDFVLLLRSAAAPAPVVLVETDNRPSGTCGITALVAFRPEFDPGTAPSELWLVVDRSGSMQGSSMEEARNALQLCLRSLSPGHRFNIVGFGSSHELLFPSSRPYDQASLREASAYAAAIQADLGGTELLPALTAIVEQPLQAGHSRQLFVLTDGQISNTEEVIALAREHSVDTRIFTFGIGAGASRHLVSGLARAGEGQAEFIAPGERMEGKVLRQLRRALAPALTGVEVDWGTRKVTQAPLRVPAVFDGGRVLVYGLLEPTDAPFEVVLRAHYGDKRLEWRVTVDPSRAVPGTQLRTLAARGLIRDLEEGMSPLHDRRGSLQERGREDRVRQAIIRLGTTYGLTSRHTSLVAVEHRDQPESAEAQLRRVPILLTRGWGGFDAAPGAPSPAAASDVSLMLRAPSPAALAAPFTAGRPRLAELADEVGTRRSSGGLNWPFRARAGKDARRKEPGAAPKSEAARRPLDALIELQEFDGSWDLTAELARVMGQSLRAWQDALGRQGRDPLVRRAVGTGLALRWLEENAATERGEWELLAEKAVRWLEQCPVRPLGGGDWIESARRLVTA